MFVFSLVYLRKCRLFLGLREAFRRLHVVKVEAVDADWSNAMFKYELWLAWFLINSYHHVGPTSTRHEVSVDGDRHSLVHIP